MAREGRGMERKREEGKKSVRINPKRKSCDELV